MFQMSWNQHLVCVQPHIGSYWCIRWYSLPGPIPEWNYNLDIQNIQFCGHFQQKKSPLSKQLPFSLIAFGWAKLNDVQKRYGDRRIRSSFGEPNQLCEVSNATSRVGLQWYVGCHSNDLPHGGFASFLEGCWSRICEKYHL